MSDKTKVHCVRCRNFFSERIKNLRSGREANCPSCGRLIIYEEGSADPGIARAMTEARRMRHAILARPPQPPSER
jgi:DNA-directed RNA polymerase subunit RPC12/RpoP